MAKKEKKHKTYQDREFERIDEYEREQQELKEAQMLIADRYIKGKTNVYNNLKIQYQNKIKSHSFKMLPKAEKTNYIIQAKHLLNETKNEIIEEKIKFINTFETKNYKIKRWWYGLIKEIKRVQWARSKSILTSFIIVIVIVILLAAIFFGIDSAFLKLTTK
ncbi:preprotein translocase subunit SecE [Ureaplasma canigenitalium]|uniref:preprotein translocase subunit SecE n=1 Tax=Ureaplasma canigenitalium TaxID=42092 RepID=UPI0004E23C66|nr:preprotein translocase subunit SecE [Ureaplasma canigenitalium]